MRILGGHIHQNAGLAVIGKFDTPHPANRETSKCEVHSDHDPFGIFSHQHEALGTFKCAPRVQHIQRRAAYQQQHKKHQQPGLEFEIGDVFRCGDLYGLRRIVTDRREQRRDWTLG